MADFEKNDPMLREGFDIILQALKSRKQTIIVDKL